MPTRKGGASRPRALRADRGGLRSAFNIATRRPLKSRARVRTESSKVSLKFDKSASDISSVSEPLLAPQQPKNLLRSGYALL